MKQKRKFLSYVIGSFVIGSFISLMGCNAQDPKKERSPSMLEETLRKEYDFRERCGQYCIDYFLKVYRDRGKGKSDNYTVYSDYVSHYNKMKNRCYMLVKSQWIPKKAGGIITTQEIIDVHENKTFGVFTISDRENISDAQKNKNIREFTISGKETIISECKVLDEKCKSKEEWDKLTEPYMDEKSSIFKIDVDDVLSYGLPRS